jgi:hypothetical protein
MKLMLTIFFLCISFEFCNAESVIWEEVISNTGTTRGEYIIESSDGGIIMIVRKEYSSEIVKMDAARNIVWESAFSDVLFEGSYYNIILRELEDGNIRVFGVCEVDLYHFFVMNYDSDGNYINGQLSEERYTRSSWFATAVSYAGNGKYMVAGRGSSGGPQIIFANENAEVISQKEWPEYKEETLSCDDIRTTPHGGYIIYGTCGESIRFGAGTFCMKVNNNLETDFYNRYSLGEKKKALFALPDGDGYYLLGKWTENGETIFLKKLTPDGETEWEKEYLQFRNRITPKGLYRNQHGQLFAVGYTHDIVCDPNCRPENEDFFHIKIDADGAELERHTWGSNEGDYMYDASRCGNGDYLVSGMYDDRKLYIARIGESPQPVDDIGHSVSIYPNPAGNIIRLRSGIKANATVEIIDIFGRSCIRREISQASDHYIDVSGLGPRVYMLRIIDSGRTPALRFIKK